MEEGVVSESWLQEEEEEEEVEEEEEEGRKQHNVEMQARAPLEAVQSYIQGAQDRHL